MQPHLYKCTTTKSSKNFPKGQGVIFLDDFQKAKGPPKQNNFCPLSRNATQTQHALPPVSSRLVSHLFTASLPPFFIPDAQTVMHRRARLPSPAKKQ
jgi:hypothetical protein